MDPSTATSEFDELKFCLLKQAINDMPQLIKQKVQLPVCHRPNSQV